MLRRKGQMLRKRVINNLERRKVTNNLMSRRGLMLRKRVNMLRRRKRVRLMLRSWLWTNEGLEQLRRWGSGQ